MLILVRFSGEISTKARKTRISFTRRLVDNIHDALSRAKITFQLRKEWSRIFIETPDSSAVQVLSRVFGIRSLSVVERIQVRDVAHLAEEGEKFFRTSVEGKSFAVRARRVGGVKDPRFSSNEIGRTLGARLLPYANRVDLTDPEVTASVELYVDEAYFFTDRTLCVGGLPLGTKERALALISGGFDSAVAAWLILKRGIALDYLFLNLGGSAHLASMLPVLKKLTDNWSYGDRPQLHVIDFQTLVQELQARTEKRYWQVILKRLMLQAADQVGSELGSLALVTGEVIGQVSSQTLPNLQVISEVAKLPILRPLIGFDKHEIVDRARQIGTADYSERVEEYCALVARHPATSALLEDVLEQEQRLNYSVLEEAMAGRAELDLTQLELSSLNVQELEIEEIPDGAQVIDLRSAHSYGAWHIPGAMHLNFFEALENLDSLALDRERVIVAYCEVGIKSAQLAEWLCKAGFQAYHFGGGMRNLMAYAVDHDLVPIELLPASAPPG
ncbi:tRNA 4-thiouridine(8) synthase ThiI [Candidatus Acetothermia bacterium]|nr:tRNA 4-thiouridine(8) synthase ThiI [Candidatus Acetothermia bacterium]MBI3642833.1 tRNA 4-thiouridine(8) synthase ThiI [Candidatus Acetothermia bacterium]